ncbi:MAG: hypothetical protein H6736_15625 [Alphaproteobacteria bacterium]|nr:hypothetical protein [Alphaproteobacteria bacterium]MCB9693240.1 hypothetical protein [Alphaproteobacteria bacterium]
MAVGFRARGPVEVERWVGEGTFFGTGEPPGRRMAGCIAFVLIALVTLGVSVGGLFVAPRDADFWFFLVPFGSLTGLLAVLLPVVRLLQRARAGLADASGVRLGDVHLPWASITAVRAENVEWRIDGEGGHSNHIEHALIVTTTDGVHHALLFRTFEEADAVADAILELRPPVPETRRQASRIAAPESSSAR